MVDIVRVFLVNILQKLGVLADRVDPVEHWVVKSGHFTESRQHFRSVLLLHIVRE